MRTAPLIWTNGLDADQKEKFLQALFGSNIVVERLKEILVEQYESIERSETSDEHFRTPEWATRQAYFLGKKKQLKILLDLFNFPEVPDRGN